MARNTVKILLAGLLTFLGFGAQAQDAFPLFAPANGVLVGNTNTFVTTAATSANIRSLWSGTCDLTTYLRGDGTCVAVPMSLANPTALLGLTAINGVAATAMRSDGAPALDQGIGPTWTATHTWSNAQPVINMNETDAAADARLWRFRVNSGLWVRETVNDAVSASREIEGITRGAGIAYSNIRWGNTTDNNTFTFQGTGVFTSGGVHQGPNGSTTTPTYSFAGDPNTGWMSGGADAIQGVVGGNPRILIDSTGSPLKISTSDGIGDGFIAFYENLAFSTRKGYIGYGAGADDRIVLMNEENERIELGTNSVVRTTWSADGATITNTPVLAGPVGSTAAATYGFSGDAGDGLYRFAADRPGMVAGGTVREAWGVSAVAGTIAGAEVFGQFNINDANPSLYIFDSDGALNQKLWRINAADNLVFMSRDDTNGAGTSFLTFSRSGTTVATAAFTPVVQGPSGGPGAGAPTFGFTGDTDTGIYLQGANDLAISTGGTMRWDVDTTDVTTTLPLLGPAGAATAANVTYSFSGDSDTGAYNSGTNALGLAAGGALRSEIASASINNSVPILGPSGAATAGNITYSFSGDTNTGVYNGGTDTLSMSTNGTLRWDIDTADITTTLPQLGPSGGSGAGNVTYSFSGDSDTGMFNTVGNEIGFSTNGTTKVFLGVTNFQSTLPWIGPTGAVGAPALSWSTDTTTGFYRIGAGNIGASMANSLVFDWIAATSGGARVADFGGTLQTVGFREVPQNSQSANYGIVLADSGKHILHPSGGGAGDTFTIPANGSVPYALGTVITVVNRDSNSVSIAITTDTMILGGTTTTGTRTLGQNGVATIIKVESATWIITGTGVTWVPKSLMGTGANDPYAYAASEYAA